MSEQMQYYKVTGGSVQKAWEQFKLLRSEGMKAARALQEEFKADQLHTKGSTIAAFEYNDPEKAPKKWKKVGYKQFFPSKRSGADRLLAKRIESVFIPTVWNFQDMVLGRFEIGKPSNPFAFMDGLRCCCMSYEVAGDIGILGVPVTKPNPEYGDTGGDHCGWTPPDKFCTPLKMSEYYTLKEAAEKKPPTPAAKK